MDQRAPFRTGRTADAVLLSRYAAGDARAAADLAARYGPRLMSLAWRMLNDRAEAEDVAQDAMLKLWQIAPDWREGEAQVSTWLYRVAANLCTDRLRRRGRAQVGLDGVAEPADPGPSAAERLQAASRDAALQAALAALPDRQRQAVVLRHIEGLGNPEIAAIMETGVDAVESLTARGKRGLRAALAGQRGALGYDDDG